MASKLELKTKVKKLKKRMKHYQKIMKVGIKTIADRDNKIAQLMSVLEEEKPRRIKTPDSSIGQRQATM